MVNQPQDVSSWFENVMHNAIEKRASDVHIEPERDTLNIRFRIDGLLQQVEVLGNHLQDNIVSMIKVMSNMNITERRLPQDGHFEFNYTGKIHNIRVSVLPGL